MSIQVRCSLPVLLDVTLRDGGYLNDWRFSRLAIDHAISTAAAADVDAIEVGYCDDAEELPEASRCTPKMLRRARNLAGDKLIAAMVRPTVDQPSRVLASRRGLVDLIRIPVDVRRPKPALEIARLSHQYGFDCTLNLTSANCFSAEQITAVARQVPSYVTAVYLADSRGSITVAEVKTLVEAVRKGWSGWIGYHAHNNLGLAVETSHQAIRLGCELVDASIAGVGIGGRNLKLVDAVGLLKECKKPFCPNPRALEVTEDDLGLPGVGPELGLYQRSGQCNIRQEWIEPLVARLGNRATQHLLETLPRKAWFEQDELEPYIRTAQVGAVSP